MLVSDIMCACTCSSAKNALKLLSKSIVLASKSSNAQSAEVTTTYGCGLLQTTHRVEFISIRRRIAHTAHAIRCPHGPTAQCWVSSQHKQHASHASALNMTPSESLSQCLELPSWPSSFSACSSLTFAFFATFCSSCEGAMSGRTLRVA